LRDDRGSKTGIGEGTLVEGDPGFPAKLQDSKGHAQNRREGKVWRKACFCSGIAGPGRNPLEIPAGALKKRFGSEVSHGERPE